MIPCRATPRIGVQQSKAGKQAGRGGRRHNSCRLLRASQAKPFPSGGANLTLLCCVVFCSVADRGRDSALMRRPAHSCSAMSARGPDQLFFFPRAAATWARQAPPAMA
jgi:hypothetical protein